MVPRLKVFIFSILILGSYDLQAQKFINWDVIKAVPFLQDSIPGFRNFEVQNRVTYPINESTADLEIRVYRPLGYTADRGKIYVLKFFADTVISQSINYIYYSWSYRDPYEFIGKDQYGRDVGKVVYKYKNNIPAKSILDSFQAFGIFNLEAYDKFLKVALANNIVINDPDEGCMHCSRIYCEIKLGDKLRNFYLSWGASELYTLNKSLEYYHKAGKFSNFFFSLFNY